MGLGGGPSRGEGVIHFSPPRKVLTRPPPSGQMIIKAPLLCLPKRDAYPVLLYPSKGSAIALNPVLFILRAGRALPVRVLSLIGVHSRAGTLPVEHSGWLWGTFASLPPCQHLPPTAPGDF